MRATADRRRGAAPLRVAFSAQATDPDGPTGEITYLWDFGDGGANAFGRNAEHTYREPGSYTATVTATDGDGAFDTAEVEIVVEDPAGNHAPEVRIAAAPRSGTAPLRVQFTSSASDPDGDRLTTPVWDFGDGGRAAGDSYAWTYTRPGTYTATVTVRDPAGLRDTDSVVITVGEQAARPRIRAPKTQNVRKVLRRGLRLRVTCVEACRARSVLRLSGERVGASKRLRIATGATRTVVVRLDRVVRRNLVAAMRQAGMKRITATAITTVATDVKRTYPVRVTLRR